MLRLPEPQSPPAQSRGTVLTFGTLPSGLSEVTYVKCSSGWACMWSEFGKYLSPSLFSFFGSVGGESDQMKSVSVNLALMT